MVTGMQKKASSYPPGYRGNTVRNSYQDPRFQNQNRVSQYNPGNGFAVVSNQNQNQNRIQAQGAGYNTDMNDPYQQYNQANQQDNLWRALMTEAGRQAIGAQLAVPIRTQLDYQGVSRRFFEIDVLAQGQIARYDKDIEGFAAVVAKRAESIEFTIEGEYVEPTTWEIFSPTSIRLSNIQQRRFNVLDRMQEKIRIYTQIQEDTQFLQLIATTTAGNTANNAIVTSTAGVSKSFLNRLSAEVMKHDLPGYAFLMNFDAYRDIRAWTTTDLDPVTLREIQQSGLYANIWGIDIIVSRLVPDNTVYCLSEPRFTGVLPIRTDMMVMPDDVPRKARIGYVGYEEIGMLMVNANAVAKGTFTRS